MLWRGRIYSPLPFLRSSAGRRVNTGVWGTAAFPSVYSTNVYRLHFLPHSPTWMAASLALLVAGAIGLRAHMDAPWLLLAAGLLGWTTTVVRCVMFAWRSDFRGLPPIGRWSLGQSRYLYRALTAWLHLIQPLARLRGRLRGLSSLPRVVAPKHVTRHPWKTPVPSLRDACASVRLFTGSGTERSFWSELSVLHTALLTELAGVLRASRPAQLVDVDDGWRSDRDLSLAVGRWGWLHVRTLLEEHERGRCLFRVRTRLRPSVVGTVQGLTLAVLLAGGASAAMALHRPSVSVGVLVGAVAAIAARTAWQATRAAATLSRALVRVTSDAGMLPLPIPSALAPRVSRPAETARARG
jgi:hypothetical protein